ncbi:response regulator [Acidaminobacter sp. JC074]|uniref:response regulator transcription factor n=1 Tax=Acidaminobacter sp. JC074 TaxID=2530199 RepID=UPI001F0D1A89|nr:response regulator [Acidaminobacter sp. JC074]MCH4887950.1 response regulator [Acidaminobacter sp. JC074]
MYKILIADDEPKVIQLIEALIDWDRLGLELVSTVRDGISALAEIQTLQPDIVITDIRMPGYDGIELIKKVRGMNMDVDFIIISGYQHFDYAHTAIKYDVTDYLLKPLKKQEINDVLKKMVKKYDDKLSHDEKQQALMDQVLSDQKVIRETFSSRLFTESLVLDEKDLYKSYHISFLGDAYRVICIKPDINYHVSFDDVLKLLIDKCKRIVSKSLSGLVNELFMYDESGFLFVFINYESSNSFDIRNGLLSIINEINSLRDLFKQVSVSASMSNEFAGLESFPGAYEEARSRMDDKILSSTSRIIDQGDFKTGLVSDYLNDQVKDSLVAAIRELNVSSFKSVMDKFVQTISLSKDISGGVYFEMAHEVIELVISTMTRFELLDDITNPSDVTMYMAKSVHGLFDYVTDYSTDLLSIGLENRKKNNLKPVEEAKKIIQASFSKQVSLEWIASQVGFNPSYFSTLFKRETGQKLIDYLTQVRMDEAKRLLSDGQVKIGEIGMMCGYLDNKHFSKQFKKYTGLSPSQYKKLYY